LPVSPVRLIVHSSHVVGSGPPKVIEPSRLAGAERMISVDQGTWLRDRAAIIGIGHTKYGRRGEHEARGHLSLVTEAVKNACADAGISPRDIDGWASYSNDPVGPDLLQMAFGTERVRFTAMGWGGGGGALGGAVMYAAMAVATGQANYVAVTRGVIQTATARFGGSGRLAPRFPGLQTPGQSFALAASRHMHDYGTTTEHFAEVAINARLMAAANPDARFRDPITLHDHHASPMMSTPLRRLDYCMESDGGACFIVTSSDRARDAGPVPVLISGVAMGGPYKWGGGMFGGNNMSAADFASAGQRTIGEDLYRYSGLGPEDLDVALIYDHFTPMVLMALEDFQIVKKGESGPFVADGNIRLGSALPVNTHGGNLAEVYLHGMTHVFEAVRQLRGTSHNQISDAELALVVAGSSATPTGGMILRRAL
jgi:acetyl-CoA acetyltransferase